MANRLEKMATQFSPYLFLIAFAIILLYPVIDKSASFCIKQDNVHQGYPFFAKLNSSLHKGYLPVWDANTYGGRNFAGGIEPGIFYPPSIICCLIFGSDKGIDVYYLDMLVCLHYLICLMGMYKVARAFRLPVTASIFSALVFTFTSSLSARSSGQTWTFFSLALLPWTIYFVVRYYLFLPRKRYFIFAGLVAGLQILAGHIQPLFHAMVICGITIIFFEYKNRKSWLGFYSSVLTHLIIIILFISLLALPQLYYSVQNLPHAFRYVSGGTYIKMGQKVPMMMYSHWFIISLQYIGNLFCQPFDQPDDDNIIYMGILPLFLLLLFLIQRKSIQLSQHQNQLSRLLLIILILGTLASVGYLTFFCYILYYIPLVNTIRELGRYIVLISFSASLLVGMAIANIAALKECLYLKSAKTKLYILGALFVNFLYLTVFQQQYVPLSVSLPYLLCVGFFLLLTFSGDSKSLAIPAIAILCIDLLMNPVNFLPTNDIFYPTKYYSKNRILDFLETTYGKYRVDFKMQDYTMVWRNVGDVYNIQTKYGYAATVNENYYAFALTHHEKHDDMDDLLNIRYIIADQKLDSNYIFRDSIPHYMLYERKNYYPRWYWKHQLGEPGKVIENENSGTFKQIAYSDLYQKLSINCLVADTLIFSENDYPGWKCYDNGKEIKIAKPNIGNYPPLFRSIYLDSGHHEVEFTYNKVFHWF